MEMKLGIKEVGGVLAGVVIGRYVFQSKNAIALTLLGISGGIIAHYAFKKRNSVEEYISDVEEDVIEGEDESNFYGTNKEIEFDKQLGYHTPQGELTATEPKDYMDISF